jgi:histidyl-tRNA synthetase
MQLKKQPVSGMKDILPSEMEIRQYLLAKLRNTYSRFGFLEIETPIVEHTSNLTSSSGWENEKLIFKVLKRGASLTSAVSKVMNTVKAVPSILSTMNAGNQISSEKINELPKEEKEMVYNAVNELSEEGLRYDLTLPLCRYYSDNKESLPIPFRAMQFGSVFRADRPQKGRFRQFMQCDIDIFGDSSNISEIDILLATSSFFKSIDFDQYDFHFVINDRRILKLLQKYSGFDESKFEEVCIIVDKLDKIGIDGVKTELLEKGFDKENVEKYISLIGEKNLTDMEAVLVKYLNETTVISDEEINVKEVFENLKEIIDTVEGKTTAKVVFEPNLVRGMGYYTGPIFEMRAKGFDGSIGGGGRYDNLVEKFTGQASPACGVSIGFERLVGILLENGFEKDEEEEQERVAFLLDKNLSKEKKAEIFTEVYALRSTGKIVLVATMSKNKKFQKEQLSNFGYTSFKDIYE